MAELKLLIHIVRRDDGDQCTAVYKQCGAGVLFSTPCNGTASKTVLDYLGIERTEKLMLETVADSATCRKLLEGFRDYLGINVPGAGIAMTIPVDSVGGASTLKYLTGKEKLSLSEVNEMQDTPFSLIMVIVKSGHTDLVMDAAREAGARGGTVVHAKGTGAGGSLTSKFFGMSIADEKEIIYIAARQEDRNAIMRAIMDKAGIHTDAQAAVLSLPVEEIAGLRSVTGSGE